MADQLRPLSERQAQAQTAVANRRLRQQVRRLQAEKRYPRTYRRIDPETSDGMDSVDFDVYPDSTGDGSDNAGYGT